MAKINITTNRTDEVSVSKDHFWIPIDPNDPETPYGQKCLLIREDAGVGYVGILTRKDTFVTHYFPYPSFKKDKHLF